MYVHLSRTRSLHQLNSGPGNRVISSTKTRVGTTMPSSIERVRQNTTTGRLNGYSFQNSLLQWKTLLRRSGRFVLQPNEPVCSSTITTCIMLPMIMARIIFTCFLLYSSFFILLRWQNQTSPPILDRTIQTYLLSCENSTISWL